MYLLTLTTLFCVFVTSSSRSISVDADLSITPDNATLTSQLIELINVDLDFDSGEFSEFLRCSTCLTECVRIEEQESYFLCKNCLKSCANQTDAFMHFFSAHQCAVNSPTSTVSPPAQLRKPLSKPKSEAGVEYLDQYMENRYFSDKCDVTEQQFKDMQQELSVCKTQLGNQNAQWLDYPEDNPDYSTRGPHYPEYPDETSDNPDKERSNNAPTTSQTTTFDALQQFGTTFAELTKLLRKNPTNGTELIDDDIEIRNFTNEEIAAIVRKFKSMFVTKQQYEKLVSLAWGKGGITLKSADQRQAACATRHQVYTPDKAPHRSGRFMVQVLQIDEHRQPFIYAECASGNPSFDIIPPAAECRTVPVQRAAVIVVDKKSIYDLENCMESRVPGKYICRDWINVAGACSLFI